MRDHDDVLKLLESAAHEIGKARSAIATPESAAQQHGRRMLETLREFSTEQDNGRSLEEWAYRQLLAIREAAPQPSSDPRELGESYARGYAAGADEVRRTAPNPGRLVIGGPVPKAGEKSENVYLREEVADLKAARDEAKRETGEWRKAYDATATAMAEVKAELAALRPTPPDDAEIRPGMDAHLKAHAPAAPLEQEGR